ncbi:hypothetical protein ACWECH_28400, partial [Micromonospora aurantiaca (nom. illeg.)]
SKNRSADRTRRRVCRPPGRARKTSGARSGDDGAPVALLAGGAVAGLLVVAGIVLLVARRARAHRTDH